MMKYMGILYDKVWLWKFKSFCLLKRLRYAKLPRIRRRLLPKKEQRHVSLQYPLTPKVIPKTIWTFWYQGWKSAPPLVQLCRESWIVTNPGWDVVSLDIENAAPYAEFDKLLNGKEVSYYIYSEILRVNLLSRYGGVWVDATTFCSTPLDTWLLPLMQSGFFAFSKPGPDRTLSSWFLAAQKNNPSIEYWRERIDRYWTLTRRADRYLWLHDLFEEGLPKNPSAYRVWLDTPHVSADGPHLVKGYLKSGLGKDDVLPFIHDNRIPIHKLSWKIEFPDWFLHALREIVKRGRLNTQT